MDCPLKNNINCCPQKEVSNSKPREKLKFIENYKNYSTYEDDF